MPAQLERKLLGNVTRTTVYRGVGDDDGFVLGLVACPSTVLLLDQIDVVADDDAMQRADHLDVEGISLVEQFVDLRAVLAHDVGIVATRLVEQFLLEIVHVVEKFAVQPTKGAKRVGREQDLVLHVVGDHDLGPMDHGRRRERKRMRTGRKRVPIAHDHATGLEFRPKELPDERLADLGAYELCPWMRIRHRGKGRAVVGLDVIDDDVVNLAAIEQVFERLEEALLDRTVDGVEEHDLLVEQQIVVIGHAVRHGMTAFEEPEALVVSANPKQAVGELLFAVHGDLLRTQITLLGKV